ncbi:MAG: hypothetical protein JWN18_657 [Parcubacteria group bacterium]|nr:hypothetical protein [Parcubacteria group bacterium]
MSAFAIPVAAQAGVPFFGPIIPAAQATCPGSWSLLIVVINNIISLLLTLAIVLVAPLAIAYAGFLFVITPYDASGHSKAKEVLKNTIIGLVVAFAGYLIVAAVMAVLYKPADDSGWTNKWSDIIRGNVGEECIKQAGTDKNAQLNQATPYGGVATSAGTTPPLSTGTDACNPAILKEAVPSLITQQMNTFACLAGPESSCGAKMQNDKWNIPNQDGRASTAYGAFQILLSTNHLCFENSVCYSAAGGTGPLECQKGFDSKGFTAGGNATILARCLKAAANLACNTTAAVCVLGRQPNYTAWTADPRGAIAQKQCIAKYAGT